LWWATPSDFVLTHDRNIFRPKNVLFKTNLTLIALVIAWGMMLWLFQPK